MSSGRPDGPAQTPAGHRERLRRRARDHDPLVALAQSGGRRVRAPVVEEAVVRLVVDQPGVAARAPVDDPFELVGGRHGSGRIVGRVDDDAPQPGRRAGLTLERRGRRRPAVLERRLDEDRPRSGEPDHLGKRDPVRREERDVVALVEESHADVEDGLLGAGRDDDVVARDLGGLLARVLRGDRVPQGSLAGHVRVLGPAALDGPHPGLPDVARRGEIRLADRKVHDVDARGRQSLGLLCRPPSWRRAGAPRSGARDGDPSARPSPRPSGSRRRPQLLPADATRSPTSRAIQAAVHPEHGVARLRDEELDQPQSTKSPAASYHSRLIEARKIQPRKAWRIVSRISSRWNSSKGSGDVSPWLQQ